MEINQITYKKNFSNDASRRVYGTPTIEELQRRVEVRQQEKKKKRKRKNI